jgi:uncharacterized protein YbjT (DUF2867 family)
MSESRIILVVGATGQQGKAIVHHLLKSGNWKVRGLTRDVKFDRARQLQKKGVEVVQGDVLSRNDLLEAMKGVYGVVAVFNPRELGVEKEIEAGKLVGDIAKECAVQHFVYSSVGGASEITGIPWFDSKHEVEQHLFKLTFPYLSIIRPVWFMENFINMPDIKEKIDKGILSMAMKAHQKLQMVAVDDIGGFIALMFEKPGDFGGRQFEFAGDEKTMEEYAAILGCSYEEIPLEKAPMREMFEWFQKKGYHADIQALRKIYPNLTDFETWAKEVGLAKAAR